MNSRVQVDRPILTWSEATSTPRKSKLCDPARFSRLRNKLASYATWKSLPYWRRCMRYSWSKYFLKDVFGGFTVGIMNIPQGMAYSMMAGLPPIQGLYVGFFGALLYTFLGQSPQLSIGTFAICSILMNKILEEYMADHSSLNQTAVNGTIPVSPEAQAISVSITITFLVGVIQLVFGICRMGAVTSFLSPAMINGFTSGSALHVLTSQIPTSLGIKLGPHRRGFGELIWLYYQLLTQITETNMVTVLLTLSSIGVLLLSKHVLEPWLKKCSRFNFPMPMELIVVITATVISSLMGLKCTYGVSIVGTVPKGMPEITMPQWSTMPDLGTKSFILAIILASQNLALVKLMASRYGGKINYNRELLTYGAICVGTSFFGCFTPTGSLSRSMVLAESGARTMSSGLYTSIVLLFVILFLGPYFEATPKCVLSSIILVALRGLLRQLKQLTLLWKSSKVDFTIFLLTFLATAILDVTYGLIVGLVLCCVLLMETQRRTQVVRLHAKPPYTDIYIPPATESGDRRLVAVHKTESTTYEQLPQPPMDKVVVLQIRGSLNFASYIGVEKKIVEELQREGLWENKAGKKSRRALRALLKHRLKLNPSGCFKKAKKDSAESPLDEAELERELEAEEEKALESEWPHTTGTELEVKDTSSDGEEMEVQDSQHFAFLLVLDLTCVARLDYTSFSNLSAFERHCQSRNINLAFVCDFAHERLTEIAPCYPTILDAIKAWEHSNEDLNSPNNLV